MTFKKGDLVFNKNHGRHFLILKTQDEETDRHKAMVTMLDIANCCEMQRSAYYVGIYCYVEVPANNLANC